MEEYAVIILHRETCYEDLARRELPCDSLQLRSVKVLQRLRRWDPAEDEKLHQLSLH